jgi:hypothetical protein
VIAAAVLFGIPSALFIAGIVAVALKGAPPRTDTTTPTAPPSVTASADTQEAAQPAQPEPDPLDPFDLAPGDCYNSVPLPVDGSSVKIATVEPVPCTEAHTAQVVARFAYFDLTWSDATDARSKDDCQRSFGTKLPRSVLNDDSYKPGLIHSDRASPGLQNVFAACVIATDVPTTKSVVKN